MIRVGPLSRARLRAAWVEELERQRDDARARTRGLEVERDQARRDGHDDAMRSVREVLGAAGHGNLVGKYLDPRNAWREVDEAIANERQRLDHAQAQRDSALNTIGQIAAALDLLGAPQRFSVPAILERARMLGQQHAARSGLNDALPREAFDPAMGGDIEPPPGRSNRCGATDAPDIGHGPCHQHPGHGGLHQDHLGYSWMVDAVEATIHCGLLADGVECGGEDGHPGGCWPDPRALAREALVKHDIVPGWVAAAAAFVLDEEHLLTDRGLTVDGDVLTEVIGQGLPTEWNDQACRATADRILDAAVHAGMTVVQGPDLTPRQVAEVPF